MILDEIKVCGVTGCHQRFGLKRLRIKMWAKGHKKRSHDPMKVTADVPVCSKHQEQFLFETKDHLFHQAARANLKTGHEKPNRKNAEYNWVAYE